MYTHDKPVTELAVPFTMRGVSVFMGEEVLVSVLRAHTAYT